jgi:hypothetical protein
MFKGSIKDDHPAARRRVVADLFRCESDLLTHAPFDQVCRCGG